MTLSTKAVLVLSLLFVNPYTAAAGDYRLGTFAFDIPGSWQVKVTQTEIVATQGERKPIPNSLLKMELCISTEARPCKAEMFFPPKGANPENYYCGESLPTVSDHENGLKELRKICSVTSQGNATYIGMLYLTTGRNNLGLIVLFDRSSHVPAEFLDLIISSLSVK